jgi:hypothetical protein
LVKANHKATRQTAADWESVFSDWLLYSCFIRIGLDKSARDGKSTKAHDPKKQLFDKSIENIA